MYDNKLTEYTLCLLRAALYGQMPPALPDGIDIDKLFEFCFYHKIENTVYYPLLKLNVPIGKFKPAHSIALARELKQDFALEVICKRLDDADIAYMPLKGSIIKHLYPSADMRESADIDILIDASKSVLAKDIMLDMGYTTDEALFGLDADDSYEMRPFLRVELHRTLIHDMYKWKDTIIDIEKRRILKDGCQNEYELSKEDFYSYMIIHMAKHMQLAGGGIKFITDIWIWLSKMNPDMDIVSKTMKQCGLERFESNVRELAMMWFGDENTDNPIIPELADYILQSGWIGKDENREIKHIAYNYSGSDKLSFLGKLKYYGERIFLRYDRMCKQYPILENHKLLLPIYWIKRLFGAFIMKRDRVSDIFERSKELGDEYEKGKVLLDFDKRIGIE